MKSLMKAASIQMARVRGSWYQPLVLEKVSNNKVEVAWPLPVSADTCTRFLKLALGAKWRKLVTDLAGVQGAHQEAGTAEEEVVVAEAAGEEIDEAAIEAALLDDAPVSRGAFGSAAGPFSQRPPSVCPSTSGWIASSAATAEASSGVNLLAVKLETIIAFVGGMELDRYEDLHQTYTVNWAAELGQGSFGKVYVGTKNLQQAYTETSAREALPSRCCGTRRLMCRRGFMRMPSVRQIWRSSDTLLWACTRTSLG